MSSGDAEKAHLFRVSLHVSDNLDSHYVEDAQRKAVLVTYWFQFGSLLFLNILDLKLDVALLILGKT